MFRVYKTTTTTKRKTHRTVSFPGKKKTEQTDVQLLHVSTPVTNLCCWLQLSCSCFRVQKRSPCISSQSEIHRTTDALTTRRESCDVGWRNQTIELRCRRNVKAMMLVKDCFRLFPACFFITIIIYCIPPSSIHSADLSPVSGLRRGTGGTSLKLKLSTQTKSHVCSTV